MPRPSLRPLAPLVVAALLLSACKSPEATRGRGASVDVHGKTDPFRGTPALGSPR